MNTKAILVATLLLTACTASSGDELAFETHGARTTSVDASGYGDSTSTSGWITAGDWTLSIELPKSGSTIDALHGSLDLRESGGSAFGTAHGGSCTAVVSSTSPSLAGTFSCTGLSNAKGDMIDASGHFSISPASIPGDPAQNDPCKSGLPDLYCR